MTFKHKIVATLTAVSIIGGGVIGSVAITSPAAATPLKCQNAARLYPILSGIDTFDMNESMYASLPCNFKSKQEMRLFNHFLAVNKAIKQSRDSAYLGKNYHKYQQAAKRLLMQDVTTYTLPMFHIGGTKNNSGLIEVSGRFYDVIDQQLTVSRASHIYKVLFYTQAYLESQNWADKPFEIYDAYDKITHVYKLYKARGSLRETLGEIMQAPSLYSIYSTVFTKSQNVADQEKYTVIRDSFSERIQLAFMS